MEPIPETYEALQELEPFVDAEDLLQELLESARRLTDLVPDCIGFSLASLSEGVTFTLVASDRQISVLDAVQYLHAGPCVEAVDEGRAVAVTDEGILDEERWRLFALATASAAVRSTLTLPVVERGDVVGSVNLYGASRAAFDELHEAIAEIFHAWAPGAVANADLSFRTLESAREAPGTLRDSAKVETATGFLCAQLDVDPDDARARLDGAATRAGITSVALAAALIALNEAGTS